jgi:hypothetical protein
MNYSEIEKEMDKINNGDAEPLSDAASYKKHRVLLLEQELL